jgi:ornithine--oxo-acid transaminase
LLAEEHEGIEADMTLVGKALSGGFYPVSAVLSSHEVMNVLQPGEHGSTFGGNPLACAVARTAIRVIVDENMVENADKMGEYFRAGLNQIETQLIKEIRGRGLLIAIELNPEAGGARKYCQQLEGLGILCKETHNNIIRFAPPLVITKEVIDWAMENIDKVFSA